jgi:hypothetical protein
LDGTNHVQIWQMKHGQLADVIAPSGLDGTEWHLEGVGNFAGDANSDLLWINNSGAAHIWEINGSGVREIPMNAPTGAALQLSNSAGSGNNVPLSGTAAAPGGGNLTIANKGKLELIGASNANVTFTGTAGTLKLDNSLAFAGNVSGLIGADALDLYDVKYGANTKATFSGNSNGGTLAVTDGSHTAQIALLGDYTHSGWTLSGDGNGGTIVVDPPLSSSGAGGTPVSQQVALLSQYMASTLTDSGLERGSAPMSSDQAFALVPLLTQSPVQSSHLG